MARETDIRADGNSPLTSYVDLLVIVPHNFRKLLDRDTEAARILTAEPALPEAIKRADRWYWDRQREKQTGEPICTPRIWTRRDEKWLKIVRGINGRVYGSGFWPERRAARYLRWLWPRSGPSLHDQWFRRAFDEARQDGTAEVICPKLEQAKEEFERMMAAARLLTQGKDADGEFTEATWKLGEIACELMDYTKRAEDMIQSDSPDNRLTEASNGIESLSRSLALLPVLATKDQTTLAAVKVSDICNAINKWHEYFHEARDDFTRARAQPEPLSIAGQSYVSAHAAAIVEANSFLDFLSSRLNPAVYKAIKAVNAPKEALAAMAVEPGVPHRVGFDVNQVVYDWELAKAAILDRLNDQWRKDFASIPARIEDERARLGLKIDSGFPPADTPVGKAPPAADDPAKLEAETPAYPSPNNYARDKWIYENIENFTCDTLSLKLREAVKKDKWQILTSRNGFKKAADRYATFHKILQHRFPDKRTAS